MVVWKTIELVDADETAFNGLTDPADQTAFIVAKLAAIHADQLNDSLTRGSVTGLLSADDQDALGRLIVAVQNLAVPEQLQSAVSAATAVLAQKVSPAGPEPAIGGAAHE
jgi:hypothetical protein